MYSKTRKFLEDFDNQHDFERMCADVLNSLGYTHVVLQAPRGGGDVGKDITFTTYSGGKGLACVTLREDIEAKFNQDFTQREGGEFELYYLFCTAYLTSNQKIKFAKYCIDKLNAQFAPIDIEALRSLLDTTLMAIRKRYLYADEQEEQQGGLEEITIYQIEGRRAFEKAREASDWETELQLTIAAMEKYPAVRPIEGRRRHLALRMSQAAAEWFIEKHETEHLASDPLRFFELRGIYDPHTMASHTNPPLAEVIQWLDAALAEGEDSEGDVLAALALAYGINVCWDKMISAITRSLAVDAALKAYFRAARHLIMLVNACESLPDRLQSLGELLDVPLPVAEHIVRDSIEKLDLASPHGPYFVDWFAVLQPMLVRGGQSTAGFPAPIRIFKLSDIDGDQEVTARCHLSRVAGYAGFHPGPDDRMPLTELVAQVGSQLLFVCPAVPT